MLGILEYYIPQFIKLVMHSKGQHIIFENDAWRVFIMTCMQKHALNKLGDET